jgi:hypothetical protein
MPTRSRDLQHHNIEANELQIQRERLRQALVNGASLEDVVDLMRSMRVLLPKTARKQTQSRIAGKFAAAPSLD